MSSVSLRVSGDSSVVFVGVFAVFVVLFGVGFGVVWCAFCVFSDALSDVVCGSAVDSTGGRLKTNVKGCGSTAPDAAS